MNVGSGLNTDRKQEVLYLGFSLTLTDSERRRVWDRALIGEEGAPTHFS